jgi:hypothetical protein
VTAAPQGVDDRAARRSELLLVGPADGCIAASTAAPIPRDRMVQDGGRLHVDTPASRLNNTSRGPEQATPRTHVRHREPTPATRGSRWYGATLGLTPGVRQLPETCRSAGSRWRHPVPMNVRARCPDRRRPARLRDADDHRRSPPRTSSAVIGWRCAESVANRHGTCALCGEATNSSPDQPWKGGLPSASCTLTRRRRPGCDRSRRLAVQRAFGGARAGTVARTVGGRRSRL